MFFRVRKSYESVFQEWYKICLRIKGLFEGEEQRIFKEFKSLTISFNISTNDFIHLFELKRTKSWSWENFELKNLNLSNVALHESWNDRLTDVYHVIWSIQPFRMYICCPEDLLDDFCLKRTWNLLLIISFLIYKILVFFFSIYVIIF